MANIQSAIEYIYPLVYPFQKPKAQIDVKLGAKMKAVHVQSTETRKGSSGKKRKLDDLDDGKDVSEGNDSDESD